MLKRRKLSSQVALILAAIAAVAGLLSRSNSKPRSPGQISLPSHSKPVVVQAGKARVTKIIDGDTIHVLIGAEENKPAVAETVRLYGIDTPEARPRPGAPSKDFQAQPFAREASNYLATLCPPGTEVSLLTHDRDRYGRLLAVVVLPDGRDANKLLVQSGLARAYFLKTSRKDGLRLEYEAAQLKAQQSQAGQWALSSSP